VSREAKIAERLAALSPKKRAILEEQLRRKGIDPDRGRILPRSENRSHYPLSFAQQRLWFIQQMAPENTVYNMSFPRLISGRQLDGGVLRAALAEMGARHETLRTTFETRDGVPAQIVHDDFEQPLPEIDQTALDLSSARVEARRLIDADAVRPFDLERGPLLRASLVRVSGREQLLLLSMHHIISDGWSLGILFRELLMLYEAISHGRPSGLPALPVQYVDFTLWQREWLSGERLEEQLGYWHRQLEGAPPVISLPTDRPRPPIQNHRGGSVPIELTDELTAELRRASRERSSTLFAALLSVYASLVGRAAGEDDVVIGSPIAGRHHAEIEGLIGFFVNSLALRIDLSGKPSFADLLERVRKVHRGANVYQDLPFERLVEDLQPERTLQYNPIFQVCFGFQRDPNLAAREAGGRAESGDGGDVAITPLGSETGGTNFDLSFYLLDRGERLEGGFNYRLDLFDRTTIQRLSAHFVRLLGAAVAEPDRPLTELTGLSAAERHQQLVEWNSPEGPEVVAGTGAGETAHGLFAARAAENPERIAVVFEGGALSYGELARRAGALAHRLRDVGVGPESVVALAAERSPEMMVGLLGILGAGGAYLPLDPDLPADRLAFMLEDAGVRVLLAGPGAEEVTAEGLERLELAEMAHEAEPIESGVGGENPIYLIYTSGSTGQPKGVVVRQRALAQRLLWSLGHEDLGPEPVYLQKTPLSFDVSVAEIFVPLTKGGHAVLARPGGQWDVEYLLGLIARERVTVSSFVPSMYTVLLERPEFAHCRSLKRLYTAAEAVSPELARQLDEKLGVELFNRYGPTEATIGITEWRCSGDARSVPIGRPMARAEVLVLDPGFEPAGIGAVGQIWAGGELLARGYHRRPALTAERFVPHPLSSASGERLYRTGDLGRHRGDGAIEFLGRVDHQVKVRGFRIELGEIETALADHPAVRRAAVVDRRESSGLVQLVGYAEAAAETGPQELRAFVGERLPAYMVPAQIGVYEALPLLPNGKIDRRALPVPEELRPELERTYVAPSTETEENLHEIWSEVLGIERLGVQDRFFDLGGHSLLAVQLLSRVRRVLKAEISLREFFDHPTIAAMAELIEGQGGDNELQRLEELFNEIEGMSSDDVRAELENPEGS